MKYTYLLKDNLTSKKAGLWQSRIYIEIRKMASENDALKENGIISGSGKEEGTCKQNSLSTFSKMELDDVRKLVSEFAREREWDKFHTVR